MGTLADSLFNLLMGWVRALVNAIWALFTTDHTTLLEFLGKNWVLIVVVILAAGLAIDWLVWLIRWQPYHLCFTSPESAEVPISHLLFYTNT